MSAGRLLMMTEKQITKKVQAGLLTIIVLVVVWIISGILGVLVRVRRK